jgi:hypothetical protein
LAVGDCGLICGQFFDVPFIAVAASAVCESALKRRSGNFDGSVRRLASVAAGNAYDDTPRAYRITADLAQRDRAPFRFGNFRAPVDQASAPRSARDRR